MLSLLRSPEYVRWLQTSQCLCILEVWQLILRNSNIEGRNPISLTMRWCDVVYENDVRANFNLCMFAPMFYEEITICGDEGYLKAYEKEDFLRNPRPKTYLEILRGEAQPSRFCNPCYPPYIEDSGHSGATFYEHVDFIDNIEGKLTKAATVEEGFWSVVVGVAAEESVKTGQISPD